MKPNNIKKYLLIMTFFTALSIQKTYGITAREAVEQQRIVAEIDVILSKKVTDENYNDWIKEVNDVINKYKDRKLPGIQTAVKTLKNITSIQTKPESIKKKVEETTQIIEKEKIKEEPKPQVISVQQIINEINNLQQEGDHQFVKVLRGEVAGKTFNEYEYNIWKEKVQKIIENNKDNLTPPLPQALSNLESLVELIEKEKTKEKPILQGQKLTQEEQTITQIIDSLKDMNDDEWRDTITKIFAQYKNSTSDFIQNELKKLKDHIFDREQIYYEDIVALVKHDLEALPGNGYQAWKRDAQEAIERFTKMHYLAIKTGAKIITETPVAENLAEKIKKEDARRSQLSTTGEAKMVGEALSIFETLRSIDRGISSFKTLENFVLQHKTVEEKIKAAENSILTGHLSNEDKKTLSDHLEFTKKNLFEQARHLILITLLLSLSPYVLDLSITAVQVTMTKTKISDPNEIQKIQLSLQQIYNYCNYIYSALDIITSNEKLDEKKVSELYNNLCKELFGSTNLGKDFDGNPTINSVYKVMNETKAMITKNYINNNPNKDNYAEKAFVTSVRDQINNITKKLLDITVDLRKSTIIDTTNIQKFELIQKTNEEFYEKVTTTYGK